MKNTLQKSKATAVNSARALILRRPAALSLAAVLSVLLTAGCASDKKAVHERGWIGGEYRLAKAHPFPPPEFNSSTVVVRYTNFPQTVVPARKQGILVRDISTNTPAALAGLQKGDLILELNDQPVTSLKAFERTIDQSKPGMPLSVTAYREGRKVDCRVNVGRQTFEHYGVFAVAFPTVVHGWDLWPNPDLSLVFVGWDLNRGLRHELGSAHDVTDQNWAAWVGIFELSSGKRVLSATNVPPVTAALPTRLAANR